MRKIAGVLISVLLLSVICCTPTLAYTAEDLYADLGIEYTDPHSQEDINTIVAYRCARRYVRIFSHLSTVSFEENTFGEMLEELKQELDTTENLLRAAYTLSLDEIYELESKYVELKKAYDSAYLSDSAEEVELRQLRIEDIPSYSEYAKANARNTLIETRLELGSDVPSITPNAFVISGTTDSSITIGTGELAVITSLFNGEVIDVKDDVVTVHHYNGIFTSYKGLTPSVKVGETVYQGKCIGYSNGSVSVRMRVADVFVDIAKFLEGANE